MIKRTVRRCLPSFYDFMFYPTILSSSGMMSAAAM